MACMPIQTGERFLSTTLMHIDCQARTIGAYGYGALADPGSAVFIALTGLLTIFIAIFGIRLLIGEAITGRDVIGDVLRIGIVLTIASSWPAWRVVAYDLVLNGPAEVAGMVGGASGLPGSRNDMAARLQNADDAIVALTVFGSGRLTGDVVGSTDIGDSPRGIAVGDQFALGSARTLFLGATIGGTALVRLGAGILLAIAPLMAGLFFFPATISLFFGWLRALAFCALGNLVLLVVQGAQLALLYPWLGDVLQQRSGRIFTPSAPTELLVITLGFAIVTLGLLALTAKLAFLPSGTRAASQSELPREPHFRVVHGSASKGVSVLPGSVETTRASLVSQAVSHSMRREGYDAFSVPRVAGPPPASAAQTAQHAGASVSGHVVGPGDTLGSSFKRNRQRTSASADRRNSTR